MTELPVLTALVILLILLVVYFIYRMNNKQVASSFRDMHFEDLEKQRLARLEPYGKSPKDLSYTGSASKYFPEANQHPTIGEEKLEDWAKENMEFNLNSKDVSLATSAAEISANPNANNFDYSTYMEDTAIDNKVKESQREYANMTKSFSGVARNVDQEFDQANYVPWVARRPGPVPNHGIMPFRTEVDGDDLAKDNYHRRY